MRRNYIAKLSSRLFVIYGSLLLVSQEYYVVIIC